MTPDAVKNIPRKKMRTLSTEGHTTVETDGRTMWVNNPFCIARISPVGHEVEEKDKRHTIAGTPPDFAVFAEELKKIHGVDVNQFRSDLPWLEDVN